MFIGQLCDFFALIITEVGCLALFGRNWSSPLDSCSWLLIVPLAACASLMQLETDVIVQHKTWVNARLLHKPKHHIITKLEQWAYFSKGPLTLCGSGEQMVAEPALAELWFGFSKCVHKYLHTLWNFLLPLHLRMSDFILQSFRLIHSHTSPPLVSRKTVSAVASTAALLAGPEPS